MGRLDEGGSRGECAGLFSLMDDITTSITKAFGPVLRLVESMFHADSAPGLPEGTPNSMMGVDLVTAGVWVPIATALMADAGIRMAIFSPGIASILQSNYLALDTFLAELAERLLTASETTHNDVAVRAASSIAPDMNIILDKAAIQAAQDRIYTHPKTAEFSKKWNLPIYYQLRFGDCCNKLNKAIQQTQQEGWIADVFSGQQEDLEKLKNQVGFELPLFLELYDMLLGLWRPDVVLRPLAHRFLRGSTQLVGRTISFIGEGMEGKIKFGEIPPEEEEEKKGTENGQGAEKAASPVERPLARTPYSWGESEGDVGAVAWELTILESSLAYEYVDTVVAALRSQDTSEAEQQELRALASEVLKEASEQINPLVDSAWNTYIVSILTTKCSNPLAAVKGVAATYRMTNRPPPTQASPFVGTILRPLKEFQDEFASRTPDRVGSKWKEQIIISVADRYSAAVDELITTVQRTEVALKSRKAKRTAVGGMSDGEKVKLQLFLDYKAFVEHVREVGVDPSAVKGVDMLKQLTIEAETLFDRPHNGGN
jgi:conserved oligomeric Golgi complex subunit 2